MVFLFRFFFPIIILKNAAKQYTSCPYSFDKYYSGIPEHRLHQPVSADPVLTLLTTLEAAVLRWYLLLLQDPVAGSVLGLGAVDTDQHQGVPVTGGADAGNLNAVLGFGSQLILIVHHPRLWVEDSGCLRNRARWGSSWGGLFFGMLFPYVFFQFIFQ